MLKGRGTYSSSPSSVEVEFVGFSGDGVGSSCEAAGVEAGSCGYAISLGVRPFSTCEPVALVEAEPEELGAQVIPSLLLCVCCWGVWPRSGARLRYEVSIVSVGVCVPEVLDVLRRLESCAGGAKTMPCEGFHRFCMPLLLPLVVALQRDVSLYSLESDWGSEIYTAPPALELNARIASLASALVPEKEVIAFVAAVLAFEAPLCRRSIIDGRWVKVM